MMPLFFAPVQLVSRGVASRRGARQAAIHSPAAASSGTAEVRTLLVAATIGGADADAEGGGVVVVVLTPGSP